MNDATLLDRARQLAVLTTALTQATVPLLPRFGFGVEVGTRSDAVKTLLTPPDATFAIWSVLFAACLVFAIHQAQPSQASRPVFRSVGWPAALAFSANTLWELDVIGRGFSVLSLLLILTILIAILVAHYRAQCLNAWKDPVLRWTTCPALGLLAGWITAAAIVNAGSIVRRAGSDIFQAPAVAAAALIFAAAAAISVQRWAGNSLWYALSFSWAMAGIAIGAFSAGATALVWTSSMVAAGILIHSVASQWRHARNLVTL